MAEAETGLRRAVAWSACLQARRSARGQSKRRGGQTHARRQMKVHVAQRWRKLTVGLTDLKAVDDRRARAQHVRRELSPERHLRGRPGCARAYGAKDENGENSAHRHLRYAIRLEAELPDDLDLEAVRASIDGAVHVPRAGGVGVSAAPASERHHPAEAFPSAESPARLASGLSLERP